MTARLPDRLWVPAVAALAVTLLFVAALLVRADGDVSLLVHAAPPNTSAATAPGSLTVQAPEDGFDGQFFYRLGVAPWSDQTEVAGVTNDLPALRNARWGYGALAWVTSGGDRDLVPWTLVGLNVAAAAALGALGGALARSAGRHAAWGLLFAAWPGFAYSLSMDTSELVASTFVLAGLVGIRRRRWGWATAALCAAVLTRDTTAVVPFGVALAGLWTWWRPSGCHADDARRLSVTGATPLALFAVWQGVMWARFDALPLTSSGDNNLSLPLGGLVELLGDALPPGSGEDGFRLLCAAGLVGLLALGGWSWKRSSSPLGERLAWLPAVAVVVVLNAYLWSGATAFMRAGTEAAVLSIALLLGAKAPRWVLPLTATGLGGLWVLTAAAQLAKLG